jgi:TRAP-type C4-dicarboxylate transport system substrate-binding protein
MKAKVAFFSILMCCFILGSSIPLLAYEVTYTGPPITFRRSSYIPETAPAVRASVIPWNRLLEKMTKGKIVVKMYSGGVLHGARDGFKAITSDITDETEGFPAYFRSSFNLLHAIDLPFAFPNASVGTMVAEALTPKYFKEEYEKMGVYMHTNTNITPYNLLSKKPIRTLEDLKGLKVRSGGGMHTLLWKALGAVPVSIPSPEVYSSFQRGIVDAVAWNESAFHTYELHEIGKYMTILHINTTGCAHALNRKFFDNLPPDLKRIFYHATRISAQIGAAAYDNNSACGRNVLVENGVEIIMLSPEERMRWGAIAETLWDDFIKTNEAKGLPARELVKDMRMLVEKYKGWSADELLQEATLNPIQGIIKF